MDLTTILLNFVRNHYKKVFWITVIGLVLIVAGLVYFKATTGEFIKKDISLTGGVQISIATSDWDPNLENILHSNFPHSSFNIRRVTDPISQKQIAIVIETEENINVTQVLNVLSSKIRFNPDTDVSVSYFSPILSGNVLNQLAFAIAVVFIIISIVVYWRTRHIVPAITVILSSLYDVLGTILVLNLIDYKLSIAGIGALLMILGYAIDNNILLDTYFLRYKDKGEKVLFEKLREGLRTGLTIGATTITSLLLTLLLISTGVVQQIVLVLLIAEIFDLYCFFIQNPSIHMIFLDREKKAKE